MGTRNTKAGIGLAAATLVLFPLGATLSGCGGGGGGGSRSTEISGRLQTSDDRTDGGYYVDFYTVRARRSGTAVIELSSYDFDTDLLVFNGDASETIAQNDDISEDNTDSRVVLSVREGEEFVVAATTFDTFETGRYYIKFSSELGDATSRAQPTTRETAVDKAHAAQPKKVKTP